jgi:VanZ family protein
MKPFAVPTTDRVIRGLSTLAAGLIIVQLLLLQQPDYAGRLLDGISDKLIHFVVFGLIAFFIWLATGARWPLMVWAVVVLIGAIDQTQQAYSPGRNDSLAELAADGAGATTALLAVNAMNQPKKED